MIEENLFLKAITGGQRHRKTLIFHFYNSNSFQFSTNGIESVNRSLKHFLGLGYLSLDKLDREINRFHSQKLVESFDALNFGRLRKKRRQTLLRQDNLFDLLVEFEGKSDERKVLDLKYRLLACGTVCSNKIDPSFFDCLPPLTELESEMDITAPPAFTETSFLDNTRSSIPCY